jgi:putative oxidoreductase
MSNRSSTKRLPSQLICLARFLLGLVFLYASVGKILDPKAFAENLIAYRIFDSPQTIKYVAVTLPWIEWFCGILLVLGVFVRSVSTLTTVLLFLFLAGMISALWRGLEIHCGCFGSPQETIGTFSLLRDGFFLLVSLVVWLSPVDPYSLQGFLNDRRTRLVNPSS